jgi:DNA-3-methyladenine glycosylase
MRGNRNGRRGVEMTNGPAKLCYALAIDLAMNGTDLVSGPALWVESDQVVDEGQVVCGPRVGVRGDERALSVPWRLWVRDHPYVSRARSSRERS